MFSRPQKALWARWRSHHGDQQALQDGRQIKAAVETVLDLGQITMSILGKVEGMVGAGIGCLQIAKEGIYGAELFQLDASRTAAGNDALLRGSRCGDGAKAPQTIRNDLCRSRQCCLCLYDTSANHSLCRDQTHRPLILWAVLFLCVSEHLYEPVRD